MKYFIIILLFFVLALRIFPLFAIEFTGQTVKISGFVSNDPYQSFNYQFVHMGAFSVRVQDSDISYGDYVVVEGEAEGREIKDAVLIDHITHNNIFGELHDILVSIVTHSLPEPHAGLISGIVLGDKSSISKELYDQFKYTGVAHVVVASGMNVTLVGGFVLSILIHMFNRRKAVALSIVVIWIYVFISGIEPPLVRAGIMGTISFAAQTMGRMRHTIRALIISLLLMLIVYPWWIFDIGLWLSFAATLSLILFESKVCRYVSKVPKFLREGLSTSLAAQIGVTPILLLAFGNISLIGPVVNTLVLWTVTPLMIIGLLGILLGLVIPFLGQLVLYLSLPLTTWFLFVVNLFS